MTWKHGAFGPSELPPDWSSELADPTLNTCRKKMPPSLLRLRFRARILFRLLGPFIDINKALVYGSSLTDEVELLELYLNQMGIR